MSPFSREQTHTSPVRRRVEGVLRLLGEESGVA